MPTISVIIPNFNRAKLIGETIECMLRQSLRPHEIIIIDDGSLDDSLQVIRSFGDRVRVLCQTNSGPGVARNLGLEYATSEFIQFFDSDDLCTLNKLQVQVDALERTGADFAYGPWLKTRLECKRAIYSEPPLQQRGLPSSASLLSWYLRGWIIIFQSCVFRRSFLNRVGRYRSDLMPSEDSEFLFRILKAGALAVHVPEGLVLYRVDGDDQITGGGMRQAKRIVDWVRYSEIVARQLDGAGEPVGWSDALRWRAVVWAAHRQAARCLGDAATAGEFDTRFGWAETGLFWLMEQAKRYHSGLRARTVGTRVSRCYQPGALSTAQKRLICDVGYEAMPANRPGLRGTEGRPLHS